MPVTVMLNNKLLGFYFKNQPYHAGPASYIAYCYRRIYDSCFWFGEFATPEEAEQAIKDHFTEPQ
jgi:hypothetical protein